MPSEDCQTCTCRRSGANPACAGNRPIIKEFLAVVAAQHRWCWEWQLASMPTANVFVQPQDRGTAHGVLLALLQLHARDPHATVLMLPADHYVTSEALFASSLRDMTDFASRTAEAIYLLGAEPGGPDTELGYIVPTHRYDDGPAQMLSFVEKPDALQARHLSATLPRWRTRIENCPQWISRAICWDLRQAACGCCGLRRAALSLADQYGRLSSGNSSSTLI
ncbi:MAG: sugar phosphate nucleotidyltransferase [Steroidobacteraceae bacterium]